MARKLVENDFQIFKAPPPPKLVENDFFDFFSTPPNKLGGVQNIFEKNEKKSKFFKIAWNGENIGQKWFLEFSTTTPLNEFLI